MSNVKESNYGKLQIADNTELVIKETGSAKLKHPNNGGIITLNEVSYVPELAANLLSVSKIVESGGTVLFNRHGASIKKD